MDENNGLIQNGERATGRGNYSAGCDLLLTAVKPLTCRLPRGTDIRASPSGSGAAGLLSHSGTRGRTGHGSSGLERIPLVAAAVIPSGGTIARRWPFDSSVAFVRLSRKWSFRYVPPPCYRLSLRNQSTRHRLVRFTSRRTSSLLSAGRPPLGGSRQLPVRDSPAVSGGRVEHWCFLWRQSTLCVRTPATWRALAAPLMNESRCNFGAVTGRTWLLYV